MVDVENASSIITQKIDGIKLEIDQEQKESAKQEQLRLRDLGTYDISEWAVNHLENGGMNNLSDEEVKIVGDSVEEQFPNRFVMKSTGIIAMSSTPNLVLVNRMSNH